ncbi:hypothetical protein PRNP1_013195 [Phytophthora ramorum]|uniref:uncharacterized protein n=1 Tax=Phytophthora ramorum TaxID=164328 RepID=UPI003095B5F2|nr:hypothetical protein KRP23_14114 [Phytophthora ramorum]
MPTEPTQETPDRTSSEDEQRRDSRGVLHVGSGLPPMAPVKLAAKVSLEGIAAVKGTGPQEKEKTETAKVLGTTLNDAQREKPAKEKASAKGKTKAGKMVVAKSERVDRRRKRKMKAGREDAGISQASAKMLFRCTCQALRTQVLNYDVRAREMEERNSTQAKEINEWEKRIRSLKRELHEYAGEQPEETMSLALMESKASAKVLEEQQKPTAAAGMPSVLAAAQSAFVAESSLPPAVAAVETKLHEELHKRTKKLDEFSRSVPGFIDSLDERH